MLSLFQRLPLASFCYRKNQQKLSAATRLPLGGRLRRKAVVRGSFICLAKNFQTKGQFHFRLKSFRANQSRPSFASLSLGTFPPRGRLNFCRSSCFPLPEKKFSKLHFFRQKCEAFPYVKASPCFFLLSQKSAKIVSRYAASPRGEAPPKGGGEGQFHLPCKKFSN